MLTQVVLHTKVFIFSESSGRPAWTAFFNALAINVLKYPVVKKLVYFL